MSVPTISAAASIPSVSKNVGKTAASHPATSKMVNTAITTLNERGGSSLHAIVKYVSQNYPVDIEKYTPHIKRYLKNSLATGAVVNPKGIGLRGSFKLAKEGKKETPKKKAAKPTLKKVSEGKDKGEQTNKGKVKAKKRASESGRVRKIVKGPGMRRSVSFVIVKKGIKDKDSAQKKKVIKKQTKKDTESKAKPLKSISNPSVKKAEKGKAEVVKTTKPRAVTSIKKS